MADNETDFGYRRVRTEDKSRLVAEVFDSVASRYDLMNDLMSVGLHRIWKRFAIELAHVRRGHRVLDLAGGTGDVAIALSEQAGENGRVVLSDINASMLAAGRRRVIDAGCISNIEFVLADAQCLPFAQSSFDRVTIAFGLRNVTDKQRALRAMFEVLRPGGSLCVLEFSTVQHRVLKSAYDLYSFSVLPRLGQLVAGDADSYRYLAESIRVHPDQDTLQSMLEQAGFERCDYHNLTAGVVAVHRGYKL